MLLCLRKIANVSFKSFVFNVTYDQLFRFDIKVITITLLFIIIIIVIVVYSGQALVFIIATTWVVRGGSRKSSFTVSCTTWGLRPRNHGFRRLLACSWYDFSGSEP